MGHGDEAVCGQGWWDKVYECEACQIKRLTAERDSARRGALEEAAALCADWDEVCAAAIRALPR